LFTVAPSDILRPFDHNDALRRDYPNSARAPHAHPPATEDVWYGP